VSPDMQSLIFLSQA